MDKAKAISGGKERQAGKSKSVRLSFCGYGLSNCYGREPLTTFRIQKVKRKGKHEGN